MAVRVVSWPKTEDLPADGESGNVKIDRFTIDAKEAEFLRMRSIFSPGSAIPEGTYCRLIVNDAVMMSNTPTEAEESDMPVRNAFGRMLIAGLGLGIMLHPILGDEDVDHVVVVENNPDVVKLVQPSLQKWIDSGKLEIITADFFTWKPPRGTRYDCIWMDIWPYLCSDLYPEEQRLVRNFKRRLAEKNGRSPWISTWLRQGRWRTRW